MAIRDDCPISHGWQKRVVAKTAAAGAAGTGAGSVLAILRQAPLIKYSIGTGISTAFCIGFYGSLLEGMRRLRCWDDAWNSVAAGGAAAYVLVGIHQGSRRKASSAALYCGAAAGLLHAADAYLDITHWLRPQPEGSAGSEADMLQTPGSGLDRQPGLSEEHVPPWWERWLPIRRMSDQEWADYKYEKKHGVRFKQRVAAVTEGGLPAMLEKERQRLQEQQAARGERPEQ